MDAMTLARARLSQAKAIRGWLFDPNISLIGLGWKEKDGQLLSDRLTIRFHVRQKLAGLQLESANTLPIPRFIDEFETDVPEGIYSYQQLGWYSWWKPVGDSRGKRIDPLLGGISISNERQYNYGTLGALVRDRQTSDLMCLSNWHVLVGAWGQLKGQRIYQPGRGDGGTSSDAFATLERDAMYADYDAAVAKLMGCRRMTNEQLGLEPAKGCCQPTLDMEVVKSGRKSAVTHGRISDIESVIPLSYAGIRRIIRDVFVIEQRYPGEQVSEPGDSGAIWLDNQTKCAVGLHFAGQDQPERALAININYILDALNVDLVV